MNTSKYAQYYNIVKPILEHEEFIKRKKYQHHENDSVYSHSLKVSLTAYKIAYILRLDKESVAIGALLHDFYDEPWQENKKKNNKKTIFKAHGFTHARQAMNNANKHFPHVINNKVNDIILRHMFPLNLIPPKYLESWIVTLCDKYISLEIFKNPTKLPKYIGIRRNIKIIKRKSE